MLLGDESGGSKELLAGLPALVLQDLLEQLPDREAFAGPRGTPSQMLVKPVRFVSDQVALGALTSWYSSTG